jgi:hypothetical protein
MPGLKLLSASLASIAAACGGSSFQTQAPADISGNYSVTLTNQANGCMFANWTVGSSAQDLHIAIQQQGASASATVSGVAALVLDVILGTPTFQGAVQGESFSLTAFGSNQGKDGMCTFTIKVTMAGSIDGDAIQGTLTYSETTNGSPACDYHSTCTSVETFAGVRPGDGG